MKQKLLFSLLCLTLGAVSSQAQITLDTEHMFNIKYYVSQDGASTPADNWDAADFDDSGWNTYSNELEFPDQTTVWIRGSFYVNATPPYDNIYCNYGYDGESNSAGTIKINGSVIANVNYFWNYGSYINQYLKPGKNTIDIYTYSSGYNESHHLKCTLSGTGLATVPSETSVALTSPKVQLFTVDNDNVSTDTLYAVALTPDSICTAEISWSSSNPEVATVENGIVKAISAGNTTITASMTVNGAIYSNQCNYTVKTIDADTKFVYVETAGTLSSLLTQDEQDNTTKLVIAGNINSNDLAVLRYMAGRDTNGNMTVGMLEDLDMSLTTGISYLYSDANGFSSCNSLRRIVLPKSVTELGYASFTNCNKLEEVVLQEGLTKIYGSSFNECNQLKSINIPSTVTTIDGSAFSSCSSLTSVTFEEGSKLTSIGNDAFSRCSQLKSIDLPTSLTTIGWSAFYGCSELESVNIPSNVVGIDRYAFYGCNNLTSVKFEEGSKLTSIGESVFSGCSQLKSIDIPASVISIGQSTFSSCTSLTEFNIPEDSKLTSIGTDAFNGNKFTSFFIPRGLLEFTPASILPASLETVTASPSNRMYSAYNGSLYNYDGDELVYVPRSKRSVSLSDKTTTIASGAFGSNSTKYIFSFAATPPAFADNTFSGFAPSSIKVYVPKGTVDTYSATDWSSFKLAEIVDEPTIYLSRNKLEMYAIEGQEPEKLDATFVTPTGISDVTLTWTSSNADVASVNNGVITAIAAGTTTITASGTVSGVAYSSKCDVTVTGFDADTKVIYVKEAGTLDSLLTQDEKDNTTKLVIAGNINSNDLAVLRYMAGRDANGNMSVGMLEELDMSLTTGISNMQYDANGFSSCNSLRRIVLPKSVTELGYASFTNCNKLEEVVLQEGLTKIYGSSFNECNQLKSINIPSTVTTIDGSAFSSCSSLTSVTFEEGSKLTSIGNDAFSRCSQLKSIDLPTSLTTIGWSAFYGCSELESVNIPSNVVGIDRYAFYGCNNLTSVKFEEGSKLTSIGESVFSGCSQLKSIDIPASVISIGQSTFSSCTSLTEFNIPEDSKLTSIGTDAFNGNKFTSFFIPRGLLEFTPASILPASLETVTASPSNRMYSAYNGSLYNYDGDELVYVPRSKRSVSLSDKTTTIASGAFGSNSTKYIFSFAATPPAFADNTFSGFAPSSIKVYVPKGTVDTYSATDWSSFNLAEIVDEPTIYLSESDVKFYKIKGEETESKSVYTTIVTPTGLSDAAVTWNSSANDVAMVSANGTIVQGTQAGEATITASAEVDGRVITSSLKVLNIETTAVVDVVAEESGSGLLSALGEDVVSGTIDLTVSGTINGYDIMIIRNRMPKLKNLDLTDAKIVANPYEYYTGYHTEDNRIGANMFREMTNLQSIILPKSVDYIGSSAFSNCSNLKKVIIHEGVKTIEVSAFYYCNSIDSITIPNTVHTIGENAFGLCSNLRSVELPQNLTSIGNSTFMFCNSLQSIVIPSRVISIGYMAFYYCSSLREVRIPPMVETIGNEAFSNCNSITDVYVYIANARDIRIDMNTFSCWNTATLHIPSFSYNNYYWDTQWGQFYNKVEFSESYDAFYTKNTLTLNTETGNIEGEPDATLHEQGGLVVEDIEQDLNDVELKSDASSGDGASLIASGEGNINASKLTIKINVKAYQWHFFCFPYDISLDSVKYEGEYVWRQYDGAARSRREGGWQDIAKDATKLLKGHGYIFQGTKNGELVLSVGKPDLKAADERIGLYTYKSEAAEDASWNFVGNPYTSYYNIDETSYSAPITVWTNNGYEAYRPGDDDYEFHPYQAFFVQTPDDADAIGFKADARTTYEGAQEALANARVRRASAMKDNSRLFVNLELTAEGDSTYTDKTRVVFNNSKSLDYESNCDAAKFFSESRAIQIYTTDNNGVQYSINERPIDNGTVEMGISVKTAGKFVLKAARMDVNMILVDNEMKCTHDITASPYEFTADAGASQRFTLKIGDGEATDINAVDADGLDGTNGSDVYDLSGRKTGKPAKGIYINNGVKVLNR